MRSQPKMHNRFADIASSSEQMKALLATLPKADESVVKNAANVFAHLTKSGAAARRHSYVAAALDQLKKRPGHHTDYRVLEIDGGIPIEGQDDLLGRYLSGFAHAELVFADFVHLEPKPTGQTAKGGRVFFEFPDGLPQGVLSLYIDCFIPNASQSPNIEWIALTESGAVEPIAVTSKPVPTTQPFSGVDMQWTIKSTSHPVTLNAFNANAYPLQCAGLVMLGAFD